MEIYIEDLEKFKEILNKGKEKYAEDTGEVGGSIIDLDDTIDDVEIDEDNLKVTTNTEDVYFTFKIQTDSIIEDVIRVAIKKMNKIKTMLESLK